MRIYNAIRYIVFICNTDQGSLICVGIYNKLRIYHMYISLLALVVILYSIVIQYRATT